MNWNKVILLKALQNHKPGCYRLTWPLLEAAAPEGICFKVGLGFGFGVFEAVSEILAHSQLLLKLYKIKLIVLAERKENKQNKSFWKSPSASVPTFQNNGSQLFTPREVLRPNPPPFHFKALNANIRGFILSSTKISV